MNQEQTAWIKSGYSTNWNVVPFYELAIQWLKNHTIGSGGVALSDKQEVIHTGVTDSLVPTLTACGELKLATQYKKYAKNNKGDLLPMAGPKDQKEAIAWAKYEDNLYPRALALKYLLDCVQTDVPPAQINKLLMKDLEPMSRSGNLLDPKSGKLIPGALCIYAELCYRLGHYRRGDKLLQTVCSLQLPSGGWFGSTGGRKQFEYFDEEEVSWVNLHFLDAVHAYDKAFRELNLPSHGIDINGINRIIQALPKLNKDSKALIIGQSVCLDKFSNAESPGPALPLNLKSKNNTFDVVLAVFSMAYSLRPQKMIKELFRVCKPGGTVIIVDKNITRAKHFPQLPNEQWFDANEINTEMIDYGDTQHLYFKAFNVQELFIIWHSMKREEG